MSTTYFNERFRQVILLILIVLIAVLLIFELKIFLPGFLGGITLYILSRSLFFRMVYQYKWNPSLTAFLMILAFLLLIAFPVYLSVELITPKIRSLSQQQDALMQGVQIIAKKIEGSTGVTVFTVDNAKQLALRISGILPGLLNSTAVMLTNLLMMFFVYYYLLTGGRSMERYLGHVIPLKPKNITLLAGETKMMVKANALGIPVICTVQGLVGALGYWIFGLDDWALIGFLTGVFAFFPLVGTMIIWVPIVLYLFATGQEWSGTGLAIYSLLVTGNVDYLARITLMKQMGDVHPLITVLGVIVGLNLFGFVGLIFGPLLVSYFIVLVKIYINEFVALPEESE